MGRSLNEDGITLYNIHLFQIQRATNCVCDSEDAQILELLMRLGILRICNGYIHRCPPSNITNQQYVPFLGKLSANFQTKREVKQYLKQPWKFTSSMYSCCFRLGQPNIYPMAGIAAKPSSLNRWPKSLDSGNRLPGCRYAEDKLDICIFPPIRELALQLLLNCLI